MREKGGGGGHPPPFSLSLTSQPIITRIKTAAFLRLDYGTIQALKSKTKTFNTLKEMLHSGNV